MHIKRVLKPGGLAAAYIWDFIEGMQMIRAFWDAALEVEPSSTNFDPANIFPLCKKDALKELFCKVGFAKVESTEIEVDANFKNFQTYWDSFLTGQGTAPVYASSLEGAKLAKLRHILEQRIVKDNEGRIKLIARAWAVKGLKG